MITTSFVIMFILGWLSSYIHAKIIKGKQNNFRVTKDNYYTYIYLANKHNPVGTVSLEGEINFRKNQDKNFQISKGTIQLDFDKNKRLVGIEIDNHHVADNIVVDYKYSS